MKKPVKIVLASLAGLVVVIAAAASVVSPLAERKLHRVVQLPPLQVTFAAADGQLERGEYLYKTRGCMECHGVDGAGHVVIDDKDSGFFARAPNITSGGASPARPRIIVSKKPEKTARVAKPKNIISVRSSKWPKLLRCGARSRWK